MGGFTTTSPCPPASEDEDDDVNVDASDANKDDDANSSSTDEMSTWYSYPLSLVTKKGSSFGYESSHTHRGRFSIGDFC